MASQEQKLKKTLTRSDLFSIGIGQIIGAGILSLCGVGIGMTGTGVVFAFMLAAVISSVSLLPDAQLAAACPTTGGSYRYPSRLIGPKVGFIQVMMYIIVQITISMYAITFATYFEELIPGVSVKAVALIIVAIVYVTNMFGTKSAAIVQKIMVAALIIGLGSLVCFGLFEVNYEYVFDPANLFPNGPRSFFTAAALLTFSTGGALALAELGGEVKDPAKDLPIAMIGSTLFVGVVYALIALVASGVLPWEQVANQSLTAVANEVLPTPLFYVFMLGGALGATATTLNATFVWISKPIMIACEDGWFPKKLATVNKYGVPGYIITLFFIVAVVPILLDLSLETISVMGTGMGAIFEALVPLSCLFLVKKYPQAYENSKFKLPKKYIPVFAVVTFCIMLVQATLLISDLTPIGIAFSIGYIIIVIIAAFIIEKVKHIEIPADLADNIEAMNAVQEQPQEA